MFNVKYNQIL